MLEIIDRARHGHRSRDAGMELLSLDRSAGAIGRDRLESLVRDLQSENSCLKAANATLSAGVAEYKLATAAQNAELAIAKAEAKSAIANMQHEIVEGGKRVSGLMKDNASLNLVNAALKSRLADHLQETERVRQAARPRRHYMVGFKTWFIARVFLRKYDGFVDKTWYLKTYRDVAAQGVHPTYHYVKHGAAEKRNPSPLFSTAFYLQIYPDVRKARTNPLLHFIIDGRREGRLPLPLSTGRPKLFN